MTKTASLISAAVEAADFGRPSARKSGRRAEWPYVPVIVANGRQSQILRRAFATREEAVDHAAEHIAELRADLARRLALPQMRALRERYGLPRELEDSPR